MEQAIRPEALPTVSSLRIDVWSDIACPWCYVGKRRLEAALESFPQRERTEVVWRAFELDPTAPAEYDARSSYSERLAKKYGTSVSQAEGMIRNMTAVAARDGLDFRFDRVRAGNTFAAHQLLHLAHAKGMQDALKERLLRAYFSEGEPIGNTDVLVQLARAVGIDEEEAASALASDAYAADVRADQEQARSLGISGVPFFVFAGRYAVSGAQSPEVLRRVIEQAWDALGNELTLPDGAACGPSGCE
jgi:predicted DsbA family dithiol-disulfide isomerase